MPTPFAYSVAVPSAPPCFPTLEEAVSFVTGLNKKVSKFRGNSPVFAHYSGAASVNIPLEPYMTEKVINSGIIIANVDSGIAFDSQSYNYIFQTEDEKERERAMRRQNGKVWLFEQDRDGLINNELELRRWKWIGSI
jgi:hypothetical protein